MKHIFSHIKNTSVIAIIAIILLAIIIAAPGCSTDKKPDDDITKGLNTYASEDTSYIVKLADYHDFTITKDVSVSAAEINDSYLSHVSELASRNDMTVDPPVFDPIFEKLCSIVPAGKTAETGDFIVFDYSGIIDGEPLTGGKASYQLTWLGSGHFIPGFEESIVGHAAGTTFPINVTFPSSYPQNTDLENKEVVFDITIRYILPGITDEAVNVLLEYEKTNFDETKLDESAVFSPSYKNATEYIGYTKNSLKSSKESSFEQNIDGHIMEYLYKNSEFGTVPESLIKSFKDSVESAAAMYGITVETYLYYAYGGVSMGEQYDELARFQVCTRGIFSKIIQNEKMTISQAEFEEKGARIAENYDYESIDELVANAGKENVLNSILIDKVMTLLKENVKYQVIE